MAGEQGDFDSLVAGLLADGDFLVGAEKPAAPPLLLPVTPDRAEMLRLCDAAVDGLTELKVGPGWEDLRRRIMDEFTFRFLPDLDIEPNDEVHIRGARSFATPAGWVVLDGGQEIVGDFQTLLIDSWYDLPFEEAACRHMDEFRREDGLHLMLEAGRLLLDDEVQVVGLMAVPLNHGRPELYRVLQLAEQ